VKMPRNISGMLQAVKGKIIIPGFYVIAAITGPQNLDRCRDYLHYRLCFEPCLVCVSHTGTSVSCYPCRRQLQA